MLSFLSKHSEVFVGNKAWTIIFILAFFLRDAAVLLLCQGLFMETDTESDGRQTQEKQFPKWLRRAGATYHFLNIYI